MSEMHPATLPVSEATYRAGCRCAGCQAEHTVRHRRIGYGARYGDTVTTSHGTVRRLATDRWPGRP